MNKKERVELGDRSYDIVIGPKLLSVAGDKVARIADRVLIVSNRQIFNLYGKTLGNGLGISGFQWDKFLLPDGEKYKTSASVAKIHDRLIKDRYDRDSVIVALGGGVIGDIAGFAAAIYLRGIRFIQIPTTLLAQVDSSVGGKTGVNHPKGKNLIGAFHQPSIVLADIDTLKTLPRAEILCGITEVIKYGCIASGRFFRYLEQNMDALLALKPDVVAHVVKTSCRIKADIVSDDEKEKGRRAVLNFGHTTGHAVEAVTGYKRFKHGYAVAMGMRAAAILSEMRGGLESKDVARITRLIKRAGLPIKIPDDIKESDLLKAMEQDKKVKSGAIRFALLENIGHCEIYSDISRKEIREALRRSKIDE